MTGQKVLEDRNIRRCDSGLCEEDCGSPWSPRTSSLSQILVWRLRLWGLPRLQQDGALPDEKSLRNQHYFLKKEVCACANTHTNTHTEWFSHRLREGELNRSSFSTEQAQELLRGNLLSSLRGAWPAPEV